MNLTRCTLILTVIMLLAGCSPGTPPEPAEPAALPTPTAAPARRPEKMSTPPITEAALEAETELARTDLAARLQIAPDAIELIEARFVTWSNGAKGCPEPDMMYTQALIPGYRILLHASDATHAYHGSRGGQPFYCPAERAGQPLPNQDDRR